MATVTINGITYQGNNITINNGKVVIDGRQESEQLSGVVEIRITEGKLDSLTTDASVICGHVTGTVTAGGSVNCDAVGGNVNAGGSVNCDEVGGNVSAGGSVRHG